jgi:hypothetical protein
MKKFIDLIKQTYNLISESVDTNKTANNIYSILEKTEKILNRKLTNEEFNQFTDLLVEDETSSNKQSKQEPIFKNAKYVVEIMTSRGKITRTASSQKGLLGVIKGQTNYVIMQDGKNITTKVKAFLKERQNQQKLRQEMLKKLKESEDSNFNFFFKTLKENKNKTKEELQAQTQTRVFADDYEKRIMAAVNAIEDPVERQKASQIAAEQIKIKKAGGRIAPEKRPEPDPKFFDASTGEFIDPRTSQGLRQTERIEKTPGLHPMLDPGKVVRYTPQPRREEFSDYETYRAALSGWIKRTKEQASTEAGTSTSKEFIPTLASDMHSNPYSIAAATAGLLTPAAPIFGGLLALGSGKGLKDQYEQGQFTGEAELDKMETGLNLLGLLPGIGIATKTLGKATRTVLPAKSAATVGKAAKVGTAGVVGGSVGLAASQGPEESEQESPKNPLIQQTQSAPQTLQIPQRSEEEEGRSILPIDRRKQFEFIYGPNRRII